MEMDHEWGTAFKDDLIPNAIGWFTGDAIEQEEEDDDEEEEGDDEGDDEDEDEEEEEEAPPARGAKKGAAAKGRPAPRGAAGAGGQPNPEECKQQ
jgi:nucleosome assembly protein 1-like 1